MRYYKLVINELFVSVGQGGEQGEEITEAEYNHILSIIKSRPNAPEGFAYRLTEELEWELYELPVIEEAEALQKQWEEEANAEVIE